MADRDEFYDPEEDDDGLPPNPNKGPVGDDALDETLDQTMADLDTPESEGAEPPEQEPQEVDPGIVDEHLKQFEAELPEDAISTAPGEAGEPGGDEFTADDIPEPGDFDPPESLLKYIEDGGQLPGTEDDPSPLPDDSKEKMANGQDGGIRQWQTMFATQTSLSGTMNEMLTDHEQAMSEQLRGLESMRF